MAETAVNAYRPDYATTPGEVLEYELELRQMSKAELARRTGLTEKHINTIVKSRGRSAITPETALALERALGMPMAYWLNLEANYQETRARIAEESRLERDLGWLKKIPVAQMTKLGWIEKRDDRKRQLEEVLRFFGMAGVEQWEEVWSRLDVAYRQHRKQEIHPEAVSAWLRRGELEAAGIDCAPYQARAFRRALNDARRLTSIADPREFVPALQAACAMAGVAVVFVPAPAKTGVSGATQWLNSHKAVIQLSLRYRTNDHLWFTFFHEAGHILLHGKKSLFIEGGNGMDAEKEREADRFAEEELIPDRYFTEFVARAFFSKAAIMEFARAIDLAPGVVVGRLQHRGLLPRTHCNGLKISYRWV